MNTLFFFLTFWLFASPVNNSPANDISAEEIAGRFCRCGQENQLPALAKAYTAATTPEAKTKAQGEYGQALRKLHQCINIAEIQQAVRNLPSDKRGQFEKNVQKVMIETCGEVATALQTFR